MNDKLYDCDLLYVEDEVKVRENYMEYLERFFHNVYEASNASDALKIYKKKKPSILLVDINLPGKSGIDFLREIREYDHTVKVIMLTANSDVDTLLNASELKLTKYLVKPISRKDLKSALSLAVQEMKNFTTLANKIINLKESFYWNIESKKLFHHDKECALTKKEIELLDVLLSNTNKVFSLADIVYVLWYDSYNSKESSLKTLIKGLRRKLPDGTIKNIFGIGYKIDL